jgi:hypothetical protein
VPESALFRSAGRSLQSNMPLTEYSCEVIVVAWPVEVTSQFETWYLGLGATDREAVNAAVGALEENGPGGIARRSLRPTTCTTPTSKNCAMKAFYHRSD